MEGIIMNTYESKSDVVQTLRRIDEENEASRQALQGLAVGVARHSFIQAKVAYNKFWHSSVRCLHSADTISVGG